VVGIAVLLILLLHPLLGIAALALTWNAWRRR
jgi:hypothetical protein